MGDRDSSIMQLMSVVDCDYSVASDALSRTGWDMSLAVEALLSGSGGSNSAGRGGGGGGGGGASVHAASRKGAAGGGIAAVRARAAAGGGGAASKRGRELAAPREASPAKRSARDFNDGSDFLGDDGVRAPIEARHERLVEAPGGGLGRPRAPVLHAAFRDLASERAGGGRGGDGSGGGGASRNATAGGAKFLRLAPPTDLLFTGTFDQARLTARSRRAWLLVNIQCPTEFPCLSLNRDVWNSEPVAALVRANFMLWQQEIAENLTGNAHATNFLERYHLLPPAAFPVVALIDARTGELVWDHAGALAAPAMTRFLREWVVDHAWDDARVILASRTRSPDMSDRVTLRAPALPQQTQRATVASVPDEIMLSQEGSVSESMGGGGAARAAQSSGGGKGGDTDDVYVFDYESDDVEIVSSAPPPPLPPARTAGAKRARDDSSATAAVVPPRPGVASGVKDGSGAGSSGGGSSDFGPMLPVSYVAAAPAAVVLPGSIAVTAATDAAAFAAVPGEVPAGPGVTSVCFRLPSGARVVRRFAERDSVRSLFSFIATARGVQRGAFDVVHGSPPFATIEDSPTVTIADARLCNGVVNVRDKT